MASKFRLAGGILERPVRPIWDAIDSCQFKNGLKHSATLLSKYPNSPYALALKALILERMGKNDEALSICLNAKEILFTNDSNIFIDDLTLSTLQIVFQRQFQSCSSIYGQSYADLVILRYTQERVSDLFALTPSEIKERIKKTKDEKKAKKAESMSKSLKASKSNVPKGAIPKGPKLGGGGGKR